MKSGPQAEKIKKHFQNIFRKNNLNIIVKCNLKVVDYLDVTLNLSDGSYKPFHKSNSEINYIHMESNHPPTIIKQLPLSVESRLSKLSSDENVFIQAASVYQKALKRAGYNHKLKYKNSDKYNSNNNNNQHICNTNDTKNDTITITIRLSTIAMIIGVILTIITTIILIVMITGIILKIKILIIVIIVIIIIIIIIIWTVIIIIIQGKETET